MRLTAFDKQEYRGVCKPNQDLIDLKQKKKSDT